MQHEKTVHLAMRQHRIRSEAAVDLFDMRLNGVEHARMPRQFLIGGIADIVALGPVAHRREVNVDKGCAGVAAVAKDHRLQDVGIEFQLVLDILRREEAPIGHLAHVLGPVDDPQVAVVLVKEPGIARRHPAFGILGVGGALGVLVVIFKRAGAAIEHLAGVADADFHARGGHAHGVAAHLAIGLQGDEHRCLGLAVELFEVDAQRAVEIKDFRPDRLARRIAHAHPAKTERVLERAIDKEVSQPVFEAIPDPHGFAIQNCRPHLAGVPHEDVEQPFLEPAGIFHPDHHICQLCLEHARRREVIGRPDLAQVKLHGLGALGAVDAEAAPIGLPDGKDEIPDPGHRQVGQHLFVTGQVIELGRGFRRLDDIAIGQHHALGLARRARGVEHDADAVIIQLSAPFLQILDQFVIGGAPLLLNVDETVQLVMVVFPQSARVDIDNVLKLMQTLLHLDQLVDLLLILDDRKTRAAMVHHIGHLFGGAVLIERHRDCAHGLRRHHRPVEMGPVAADYGNEIALIDSEIDQPESKRFDLFLGLCPSPALPDAVFFFPIGRLVPKPGGVTLQERRNGIHPVRRL